MISRTAESCFWLSRYMERLECTARHLEINHAFVVDVTLPPAARWHPLVIVTGEEDNYRRRYGARSIENSEKVQAFLSWDEANTSSLYSSLYSARENARTTRETISLEMWRTINELWLWFTSRAARRLYERDRQTFYHDITERCLLYQGTARNTMLHEEAFQFLMLGLSLERANQTARILDVKYHSLGPTRPDSEMPLETAQWQAILRSCLAVEPFFKRAGDGLSGPAVAEFLLLEPAFPFTVVRCLGRANSRLQEILRAAPTGVAARSKRLLGKLHRDIAAMKMPQVVERGLHATLTEVVERIAEVCAALQADFFVFHPASRGKRARAG